jgi:hyperosmotically inducible protein
VKTTFVGTIATLALALAVPAHAEKTAGDVVDDNMINASVKAALVSDKTTDAGKINVETYKGVVQLSGFVPDQAQKDAAGKVAATVEGVKQVKNSIAIGEKTSLGTSLDDSMLTSKVKAALMDAADVKSGQINVETNNGVVQLSGFVTSRGMAERAGAVAAKVEGVKHVDNVLMVKPKE